MTGAARGFFTRSEDVLSLSVQAIGRSRRERARFWRAGLGPYRGDASFVVPLLADCHARWRPEAALFRHADAQHFVAVRDGRDVGRIAATVDRLQDEVHGDRTGLFGWFETEDSEETARALVDAAEGWLREHGRDRLRGPLSYTTNGISGLLVEDQRPGPPVIDMAYNPPWYERLLLACGLAPAKDLLAFWMEAPETPDERMARVTRRLLERGRFGLRTVRTDRRGFAEDVEHVLRIYNAAWERNWGFVPLTAEEIREQAQAFRPILVPELLLFAEHDGLPVGFSLALPDINRALHRIHGRLWPWSVVRLLRAKARIDVARMITLGVVPECRRMGLEAALIHGSFEKGAARGFRTGECSWVLGDNQAIIAPIEQVGGRVYRRYRLYEKAL